MASPCEDDDQITIAVNINKQYEATKNIDSSNDMQKLAEVDKDDISLEKLREDIIVAFRKAKAITSLFNNSNYEWKIYSYNTDKADIELQNDDDLQEEIDEFCPSSDEDEDEDEEGADPVQTNKYLKLRVVFFKSML